MSNVVSANTNIKRSTATSLLISNQLSVHRNRNILGNNNKTSSPTTLANIRRQHNQAINNHNPYLQKRLGCEQGQRRIGALVADISQHRHHHHQGQGQDANNSGGCMQLLTNHNSVIVGTSAPNPPLNCRCVATTPQSSSSISHQQASTSGLTENDQLIYYYRFEAGQAQSTINKFDTTRGIKRPSRVAEKQPIVVAGTSSGTCYKGYLSSHQQILKPSTKLYDNNNPSNSTQDEGAEEVGEEEEEEEEEEEGDDQDQDQNQDSAFDYEPVLAKILNEKKLALSDSPDVIGFISSFQQKIQDNNFELND